MAEFTIGAHIYRSDRLDTFKAFHVVRRIAPLVGNLALATKGVLTPEDMAAPLLEGIAEIKEEDIDYVRDACLAVVKRVDANGQASPIFNKTVKRLMYDDINAMQMMMIIVQVIMDNLSDFLGDLPSITTGGLPGQASPPST